MRYLTTSSRHRKKNSSKADPKPLTVHYKGKESKDYFQDYKKKKESKDYFQDRKKEWAKSDLPFCLLWGIIGLALAGFAMVCILSLFSGIAIPHVSLVTVTNMNAALCVSVLGASLIIGISAIMLAVKKYNCNI